MPKHFTRTAACPLLPTPGACQAERLPGTSAALRSSSRSEDSPRKQRRGPIQRLQVPGLRLPLLPLSIKQKSELRPILGPRPGCLSFLKRNVRAPSATCSCEALMSFEGGHVMFTTRPKPGKQKAQWPTLRSSATKLTRTERTIRSAASMAASLGIGAHSTPPHMQHQSNASPNRILQHNVCDSKVGKVTSRHQAPLCGHEVLIKCIRIGLRLTGFSHCHCCKERDRLQG